jgi:hypothetical protein
VSVRSKDKYGRTVFQTRIETTNEEEGKETKVQREKERKYGGTEIAGQTNLYFGILGWIYINTFNIYPSPPLNENT